MSEGNAKSTYLSELKTHWRALASAALGLATGLQLNAFTYSLFAPQLLKEFGWSKADYALLGSFSFLMLIAQPFAGRQADKFGVRIAAAVGIVGAPLAFFAYTVMNGDIRILFAISVVQLMIGAFTSTAIYSRLIAERFVRTRGLAFAIAMAGPPLLGAAVAPLLGDLIAERGWRAGYYAMATVTVVGGAIALLLMPSHAGAAGATRQRAKASKADYATIFKAPAFWAIVIGMFLCNLSQAAASSQFALVLKESGAGDAIVPTVLSVFAIGVVVGRIASGLALDRFPPHLVATLAIGVPGAGLLLLASHVDATWALALSALLMGSAFGAEGDIGAYLISRHFPIGVFSLVMGFMGAAMASSTSVGSILISFSLREWNSYAPFLILAGCLAFAGALLFLLLGRWKPLAAIAAPPIDEASAVQKVGEPVAP